MPRAVQFILHHHETRFTKYFTKPPNYYLSNKNFLTFIKLSCNKLISTRYLSDMGYLTFRSLQEKKSQDNLQGTALFHHHHLLRISSSIFETARPSIENKRQTTAHEIILTRSNWCDPHEGKRTTGKTSIIESNLPNTTGRLHRDENTSRILSLGCRVTGRLSSTLLFWLVGCAIMRDYSVCVR